jgi:hypothetical protein
MSKAPDVSIIQPPACQRLKPRRILTAPDSMSSRPSPYVSSSSALASRTDEKVGEDHHARTSDADEG